MRKNPLNKDNEFLVGEEKIINYVLAFLCLALFVYGVIDAVKRRFINIDYQSFVFAFALIPAWLFFKKARSTRIYIRINKFGIYQDEHLVTGWSQLLKAYLDQKEKKGLINLQDNFLLVLEFRKKDTTQVVRSKLPLTNTQNKSEEEVLQAVNFFWREFMKSAYRSSNN
ncbi:MAG: hypothetical protein ACRDEB_09305 [Chitinophagaceae bacterium]